MADKTIKANWEGYARAVLPENAGPAQIEGTNRAFYAGGLSVFNMIMDAVEGSEKDATAALNAISAEFDAYQAFLSEQAEECERTQGEG